jgi:hypothetical protein
MDPYLEGRRIWPDVHHRLIAAIGDTLATQVAPGYFVAIEERAYIVEVDQQEFVGVPDAAIIAATAQGEPSRGGGTATAVAVAAQVVTLPVYDRVREGYLEIRDAVTHEVVTAIEVLSPTNKIPGEGRRQYEAKRQHTLHTFTNLVEVDLLRGGEPMQMTPVPAADYRILVAAGWESPRALLYAFSLRQAIPDVPVPLRQGEQDAVLSVGPILAEVYDRARYDLRLDYRLPPPEPTLSQENAAWVEELLRARGLRAESGGNRAAGP